MVTGVEIDMVVTDSLKALEMYESIFDMQRVEVTAYERGMNEAVFTMYGTRFHLLDENPENHLYAPTLGDLRPIWFNIMVPDIRETLKQALQAGCTEVQPVTEVSEFGVLNAFFGDPFGYLWMLHEVVRDVGFEERCRIMEAQMDQQAES